MADESAGEWLFGITDDLMKGRHEEMPRQMADVDNARAELESALCNLARFPIVYLGNEEKPGSHITIETADWAEKMRTRTSAEGIASGARLARQFAALAERQYENPTKTLLHDRLLHGDRVPGRLIIKEGSRVGVNSLEGLLSTSAEPYGRSPFVIVQPLNGDSLSPLPHADVPAERAISVHWSEVRSIEYGVDTVKRLYPDVMIPPERCRELKEIVQQKFGTRIADITFLRALNNTTYHLRLENGWKGVLKEFPKGAEDLIARDHHFSNLLAREGLAPAARRKGLRLFSDYSGTASLSALPAEEASLEKQYDAAIRILIALERLGLREGARRPDVLEMDPAYYARKCGEEYDPRRSSHRTIIPAGFFPVHVRVGEKVQVIDLEDVMEGPVEYALATLLVNPYHVLSEDFIRDRLEGYACQVPVDKARLYACFKDHAKLMRQRISRVVQSMAEGEEKYTLQESGLLIP